MLGEEDRQKVKSIYVVPCQRRTTGSDFINHLICRHRDSIQFACLRSRGMADTGGNRVAGILSGLSISSAVGNKIDGVISRDEQQQQLKKRITN